MPETGSRPASAYGSKTRIAVIGVGNLGRIMANKLSERFIVVAIEKIPEVLEKLKNDKIKKSMDFADAKDCDVAIICVKPNDVQEALKSMSPGSGMLVVSCAAGIPIVALKKFGAKRVTRIMPNINIRVGSGIIAYCGEDVSNIFSGFAECVPFDEKYISLVTALSGSGVAYFWYFARIFYQYARNGGMEDREARKIVGQVMKGCGEMLLKDSATIDELIATVATPKGTTAAGLEHMDSNGSARIMEAALKLTEERCRQIEDAYGK